MDTNIQIISRLIELAKNELTYSEYPRPHKQEYIFIANALNAAVREVEIEFERAFREAVSHYKQSLANNNGRGWFHEPEKLVYLDMSRNQLLWAIYGHELKDIVFNEEMGESAYLDLINQIDRTVLMTEEERRVHLEECNSLALKILEEIRLEG